MQMIENNVEDIAAHEKHKVLYVCLEYSFEEITQRVKDYSESRGVVLCCLNLTNKDDL